MFVVLDSGWFDPDRLEAQQAGRHLTSKMGGSLQPRFIVLHASGFTTLDTTLSLLEDPNLTYSMHLIVGRDGRVVQAVPFTQQAWHCGNSRWGQARGLNGYAIGIEMVNGGRLYQVGDKFRTWFGHKVPLGEVFAHGSTTWHAYPETQIYTVLELCRTLGKYYPIEAVLGRDEVSTKSVTGPGPAFPMQMFQDIFSDRARDTHSALCTVHPAPLHVAPDLCSPQIDMPLLTRALVTQEGDAPGGWAYICAHEMSGEVIDSVSGWVRRQNLDHLTADDDDETFGLNGRHAPGDWTPDLDEEEEF